LRGALVLVMRRTAGMRSVAAAWRLDSGRG